MRHPPFRFTPTPARALLSAALLSHISRIRREGVLIIECVLQWRRALTSADPVGLSVVAAAEGATSAAAAAAFRPFAWRGVDYLNKMLHDVDFLAELAAAPRMLELPVDALAFNPLFAPTTLANAMRTPALPAVAEHLMTPCVPSVPSPPPFFFIPFCPPLLLLLLLTSLSAFPPPKQCGCAGARGVHWPFPFARLEGPRPPPHPPHPFK